MNNKKVAKFLAERQPETPYLIVDLYVVGQAYKLLRRYMPLAKIFYAVKANPAPEVVGLLRDLEASGVGLESIEVILRLFRGETVTESVNRLAAAQGRFTVFHACS